MRIGLSGGANLERLPRQLADAEADGFSSMWFAGAIGADAMTVVAVAGHASEASRLELGTSIVPTYTRHPVAMAQQSAAVATAVGAGRFTLGLGVSHRPAIESLGLDYSRPAVHLREYLSVLRPLLAGEAVRFEGEWYRVETAPRAAPPGPVPVLVAALGPAMLRVAGELADGTVTWMTNERAVDEHVAPAIRGAAEAAARPAPRVVVGLPVAVCDAEEGREAAAEQFGGYGRLPNYRRILDAGGAGGPADVAVVGDEQQVADRLAAFEAAGATDIWAAIFPVGDDRRASRDRTRAVLRELAG